MLRSSKGVMELAGFPLSRKAGLVKTCWKIGRGILCVVIALSLAALSATSASALEDSAPAEHGDHDHKPGAPDHDKSHSGGGDALLDPIEVRHDLALWSFVVFALLLLILWKFAWGPITEALDQREQGIADKIEEAKRNAEASEQRLAEYEASISGAAQEVRDMIDKAKREGEVQKQEILSEAQAAAADEKDRALRAIAAAKDVALGQIAQKSVDEAFALAGKIVRRELQTTDHAHLIQETLEQFPRS